METTLQQLPRHGQMLVRDRANSLDEAQATVKAPMAAAAEAFQAMAPEVAPEVVVEVTWRC
jgi:hypothetical protein